MESSFPQCQQDYLKLTTTQMKSILKSLSTNLLRRSTLAYYCGINLLRNCPGTFGSEIWAIYEQIFIAALDCNQKNDAKFIWAQLAKRFGRNSSRILWLKGLMLEAEHRFDEADEHYKDLLIDTKSCDGRIWKRRVAIAKATGRTNDAISILNEYLSIFPTDIEGYHELAELHLADCNFSKACFGYEELILNDPQNYIYILKYAETLYSVGDKRSMMESRKYFSQSLTLCNTLANLRAFYGLWIACYNLATKHGMKGNAENASLSVWASDKLNKMYSVNSSPFQASLVSRSLKNNADKL